MMYAPTSNSTNSLTNILQLSFEDVVLKGLATDGGLFIPEEIPSIKDWPSDWTKLSFEELAFKIFSQYISPSEIPPADLKDIVNRSYSTFRASNVTPLVTLQEKEQIHLLELFHGPTFAFKDVALQFLGNLFEYFLVRRNKDHKDESKREHLTVVGATSGDTGSAAIYGLRGKKDVSVFIMHPKGKVSPVQEAQMTTVLDANVHNLAVDGTFDDCQDFVKQLFGDADMNSTHKLAAVNSINWARILAQITYYFHAYASLTTSPKFEQGQKVRFVVPTGNFGDILAGYFAKRMGLPIDKLVIATNENDILDRFWKSGYYEKKAVHGGDAEGGFAEDGAKAHEDGVKETLSPAMDILVSSNFERLLWFLAYQVYGKDDDSVSSKRKTAGSCVNSWLQALKADGGFSVDAAVRDAAKADFESERVSDRQTLETIRSIYNASSIPPQDSSNGTSGTHNNSKYILDPHSAIGIAAAQRSAQRAGAPQTHQIALATAHPAKFAHAVEEALKEEKDFSFGDVLPEQFVGLEKMERRVTDVKKSEGIEGLRRLIRERVPGSA